ncbi:hypothetical protein QDY72_02855 [Kingella negevensis]|uniref:hypothetical protein n=1 Tax=Kingella negevensis TaxID=1522312 RepID=UPI002549E2AD|nr:hypothetical protein [Kingella negevensis]MDK4684129.1 hypothetical protein [Kingella negevensis]MDK4708038.1 hypothetical protein [Kingella negevensis]MDK4709598.1 hypothetical protein [Kingella negevensis]
MRQNRATTGEILLNGKNVQDYAPREYAKLLAYLPQHLPSAATPTSEELVAMG